MKRAIFVGGPFDGRLTAMPDHQDLYRAPIKPKLSGLSLRDGPIDVGIEITFITYRPREILGQEVWVPQDMRDPQVMELLVNRYVRNAR